MMYRLTSSRSSDISILIPHNINCALILLIFAFITTMAHSRTDHHKAAVDELRSSVLQHLNRTSLPSGYKSNKDRSQAKLIRDFFRSKFNATTLRDSTDNGNIYLDDLQTLVFHSTDPEFMIEAQPQDSTSASSLTIVKFSTNFQQPDVPYHDLLIKSAILRMRINRQKRKLRRKAKLQLNVTFFLMAQEHHNGVAGNLKATTLLRSVTLNSLKRKVEFALESSLLSHIVDSEDKTITIGIKADYSVPPDTQTDDNLQPEVKQPGKRSSNNGLQKGEMIRVSRASLSITSQTLDLRKTRAKRQNMNFASCSDNLCCKHSIYVDFEEIGWSDWVLSPPGYVAHFCKGDCPQRYKSASSFTSIKSILHERDPSAIPAPVCAPTGYSPIELFIYDGENVVEVSKPDMLVTSCRCH